MKYILNVYREPAGLYCLCNEGIDATGKRKVLHNEVSFAFTRVNEQIKVSDGWHIGTQDFEFGAGDEWVLEKYHPGITQQLIEHLDKTAI